MLGQGRKTTTQPRQTMMRSLKLFRKLRAGDDGPGVIQRLILIACALAALAGTLNMNYMDWRGY